jgi:hypothetical protein
MKLNISRTMLLAAAALVFGPAAYAQEINVRARVPFDFMLGDKLYPAGEYAVQTAAANTYFLSIKNEDGAARGMTPSYPYTSSKSAIPASQAKLVFHRQGNTFFLYQIWMGGSALGREFPMSRTETQLALNGAKPEAVSVAASVTH